MKKRYFLSFLIIGILGSGILPIFTQSWEKSDKSFTVDDIGRYLDEQTLTDDFESERKSDSGIISPLILCIISINPYFTRFFSTPSI